MAKSRTQASSSTSNVGFEAKLWLAADKLRNNMDAAEYKHVVLGLIFLKYISDSFDEHHARLVKAAGEYEGANPEDKDEYLAPNGYAGFVLANGSMSSNQSGEGDIRKALIEADLVDCMVALPGQLFYSTQIPVCLWFLTKNKLESKRRRRQGETLFIDARKMGTLIDRVHRELTDADLQKIVGTYHAWRGDKVASMNAVAYEDVAGFCKSATTADIASHGYVLTPGRYVGAEEVEDDGEPFAEKMPRLVAELNEQFEESAKLEAQIKRNLEGLGYGR